MEETLISPSRALQVPEKYMMINSVSYSQDIIPKQVATTSGPSFPAVNMLANKNLQDLVSMRLTQVKWSAITTLGFTFQNGQTCKAGVENFQKSHTFDPAKKITKIECIINQYEKFISQINFYHNQERLLSVANLEDQFV